MTDIPVSENFEPVPGVKYDDEGQQPQEPAKEPTPATPAPEAKPEPAEAKAEEPKDEPKTEAPKEPTPGEQPRDPEGRYKPKAKPIAKLLESKHQAEERAAKAEAEAAELRKKLEGISSRPASPQTDADLKALAEKYGYDETALSEIVSAVRAGIKVPELPKEVTVLIAERQKEAEQQAELEGFETDLGRLKKTFKDEVPLTDAKVRDKLLELAYSEELAPDGEPYYKKPLHELYFGFVKPQVEPGRKSAESSQGRSAEGSQVLDFDELEKDPAAMDTFARDSSPEDWAKYQQWAREHEKGSPLRRAAM